MSDTPRTDAEIFWGCDMGNDSGQPHFQCVDVEFARELERENAAMRGKLNELDLELQELGELADIQGDSGAASAYYLAARNLRATINATIGRRS